MIEKGKFAEMLGFLASLYPYYQLGDATIKAYYLILRDLPVDALNAAVLDLGSRSTFFPAAADIRAAVFDLQRKADGELTAEEAWGMITDVYHGKGTKSDLPDAVHDTVRLIGGWRKLDNSTDGEMISHRARFMDAHRDVLERRNREQAMLPAVRERVGIPAGEIKKLADKLSVNGGNNANQ